MNTSLLYLTDTYLWQSQAKIQAVKQNETGHFIVLDSTIFYPRGGGQEADTGKIKSVATGREVEVVGVRFTDGQVLHYVERSVGFSTGEEVTLQLDGGSRLVNAANHTAGHLICGLITHHYPQVRPMKGYHFSNGPYVEFLLDAQQDVAPISMERLQAVVDVAIASDLSVKAEEVSYAVLQNACSFIPSELPKDKPLRIVTIDGLEPLPCGGTHLSHLNELKAVTIRKIKSSRGVTRVSYLTG